MTPALLARLTDAIPVLPLICAWCPGFSPTDPQQAGRSHGICPSCAATLLAELEAVEVNP